MTLWQDWLGRSKSKVPSEWPKTLQKNCYRSLNFPFSRIFYYCWLIDWLTSFSDRCNSIINGWGYRLDLFTVQCHFVPIKSNRSVFNAYIMVEHILCYSSLEMSDNAFKIAGILQSIHSDTPLVVHTLASQAAGLIVKVLFMLLSVCNAE